MCGPNALLLKRSLECTLVLLRGGTHTFREESFTGVRELGFSPAVPRMYRASGKCLQAFRVSTYGKDRKGFPTSLRGRENSHSLIGRAAHPSTMGLSGSPTPRSKPGGLVTAFTGLWSGFFWATYAPPLLSSVPQCYV